VASDWCIASDAINFALNRHLFPDEIEKRFINHLVKTLDLNWAPVINEDNFIDQILISVRDVTELRRLNTEAAEQKRKLEIFHVMEQSRNEIAALNASLEQRVQQRTAELAAVNETLTETILNLQQTQESLIQSEKLASLGALVAGIAHELNTPIGTSLTITTTLLERTEEFLAEIDSGLKRSSLNKFVDMVRGTCPVIERNLIRASELITSFKHVAVDQTSSKRREFDLHQVVKEVVDTLRHTFKNSVYQVNIEIADGILLDSYPGPLGQVITNLLNNALIHAFEDFHRGTIRIAAQVDSAQQIALEFADDGRGIASENLKQIFDPFYTTRLGKGGSGLGLNIVHNIVHGLLDGSIQVVSAPGQGTRFIINLPRRAPNMQHAPETPMH
jgi:signal transduction histidine kinase